MDEGLGAVGHHDHATTPTVTLTNLQAGTYVFQLSVTDNVAHRVQISYGYSKFRGGEKDMMSTSPGPGTGRRSVE